MCGIVGYIGHAGGDRDYFALDVVLEGLRRLEYRGYDSCGVAVLQDAQLRRSRSTERVSELDALIEGLTLHRALDNEPQDDADVRTAVARITHTRTTDTAGETP